MNNKITLRELSSQELELLLKDQKFNQLRPISCSECGNQTNFSRRVFEVKGKRLATDEDTRNLACYHVKTTHNKKKLKLNYYFLTLKLIPPNPLLRYVGTLVKLDGDFRFSAHPTRVFGLIAARL